MWKYIVGTLIAGGTAYGVMRYFAGASCKCTARLDSLVIIVTGATSGIGKALSFEIAKRGALLILACRDINKGIALKTQIVHMIPDAKVFVKYLDLNSFESIKNFSDNVSSEFKEIYAVINNAGVFYHPQTLTENGFDLTFQTNYLGPFMLTHSLLGELRNSDQARIINVASEAHRMVNAYDLKAVTASQSEFRSHFVAYGVSKLALILFTRELSKKLSSTGIIVNAVNPGNVETNIYRHFPMLTNPWLYALQWPIRVLIIKTPLQGAQTVLHALLTPNTSSGQYYSDCKLSLPSYTALNDELAEQYYGTTVDLLYDFFSIEC